MKKAVRILLDLVITILVIITITHFVLQSKLVTIINKTAIPEIKKTLNIDAEVGGASLNMFGGTLKLIDVKLGNPDRFSEPTMFSLDKCYLNIGVLAALKGRTEITEARIENAVLTFIRNEDNLINAKQLADSLPDPKTTKDAPKTKPMPENKQPESPSGKPQQQTLETAETPDIHIREFFAETMLEYIDHRLRDEVTRIAIRTEIKIHNLNIASSSAAGEGTIRISAHLDGKPDLFVTKIDTKIQPIIDPFKPSFTTDGSIVAIDLKQPEMVALLSESNVQADSASVNIHLKNVDGIYQQPESVIQITFNNCRAAGKTLQKNPDFPIIPELVIPINIKGTVMDPDFGNIQTIIGNALLSNIANNPDIIREMLKKKMDKVEDGQDNANRDRINKEVDRGLKKLGDIFNQL